jgi:hypothetical protein
VVLLSFCGSQGGVGAGPFPGTAGPRATELHLVAWPGGATGLVPDFKQEVSPPEGRDPRFRRSRESRVYSLRLSEGEYGVGVPGTEVVWHWPPLGQVVGQSASRGGLTRHQGLTPIILAI